MDQHRYVMDIDPGDPFIILSSFSDPLHFDANPDPAK